MVDSDCTASDVGVGGNPNQLSSVSVSCSTNWGCRARDYSWSVFIENKATVETAK